VPSRIESDTSRPVPTAFGLVVREFYGGTCAVVAVEGELDLATAPDLERMLDDALLAGRTIVVDLSLATFIDSTALGVLLGANRQLGGDGGPGRVRDARLAVVCARQNLLRIFEFSGLDTAFAIFPELEDALAHVRGRDACAD